MTTPELSIIIVNWNSREFLRKCLAAVAGNSDGVACEVIVVDNASYDGSSELIKQEFPRVHYVQSDANLGFSRANNLGFTHATGRYVLFLNPDTEVLGSALTTMVDFAGSRPDVGIVGPKLLNTDRTVQMESAKAFPSLVNQLLDSHLLKVCFPRLSIWGMQPLFSGSTEPAPVDTVSGASLLIKREVFETIGKFSPQYFMYTEDVDLCYKAKRAGWKTYVVPGAQVVHHGGQSSALKPVSQFAAVLMRESRFQFLRGTRGTAYAFAFRVVTSANAICRLLLLGVMAPVLALLRRPGSLSGPVHKWTSILRWSFGFERWVKELG